jgi:4-hydroxy-tetrahydrodipicolinate reductase
MGKLIAQAAGAAGVLARTHSRNDAPLDEAELAGANAMIDFTAPETAAAHARFCAKNGLALVMGTTGLDDDAHAALDEAAKKVPVLLAPNTSLGANLLFALTETASRSLPDAEIEIVELHHRAKRDSPSGTALRLASSVAEARDKSVADIARTSRAGDAPRVEGEVGVFGVRGGTVPGEHTVYLFLDDERIELTHRVTDRSIFARGAVTAATWLHGQKPGRYTMKDVLGL